MTPNEIEQYFNLKLRHPFPNRDCRWLAEQTQTEAADLIPELDLYGSNIAGYASSATTLGSRTATELNKALVSLQKDLGGTFPAWVGALEFSSMQDTPEFYQHLKTLETLRAELLPLIEQLVSTAKGTK